MWHFLYFLPLPQGQAPFWPALIDFGTAGKTSFPFRTSFASFTSCRICSMRFWEMWCSLTVSLRGTNNLGRPFEGLYSTENVSRSSFFCGCDAEQKKASEVAVSLVTGGKKFVGMARVTRCEDRATSQSRYAFRFVEKDVNWVLQ